jgi:hypothetical protein
MPSSSPSYETFSHAVCGDYAVHARTTVTFDGAQSTIRNGDVGLFPGTSITYVEFPNFLNGGPIYAASEAFADSVTANHVAFLEVRADGVSIPNEIGGLTFTPGTYRSADAIGVAVNTNVTLDGNNETNPVFLFQAPTALTVAANVDFILMNGARFENIFWALGSSATLGTYITLPGSILAGKSITFGEGAELKGCALAQVAVTFESGGYVTSGKNAQYDGESLTSGKNAQYDGGESLTSGKNAQYDGESLSEEGLTYDTIPVDERSAIVQFVNTVYRVWISAMRWICETDPLVPRPLF